MGNMSYCRFQNTLNDLRDCYDNLFDDDLSEEEERARKRLIKLCQDIVRDGEDILEEEGE
jgi:hypothetical protein